MKTPLRQRKTAKAKRGVRKADCELDFFFIAGLRALTLLRDSAAPFRGCLGIQVKTPPARGCASATCPGGWQLALIKGKPTSAAAFQVRFFEKER